MLSPPTQQELWPKNRPAEAGFGIRVAGVIAPQGLRGELASILGDFELDLHEAIEPALTGMLAAGQTPDVILLCLPDDQARYFSQLLHEDKHLALTPIILIYDQAEVHEPGKILSLGATDLIASPIAPDALIALIHRHEQTRRAWWDTFHIHGPEKPQRLLARLKSQHQTTGAEGHQDPFQEFKQFLFQKVQLLPDRIRYLQSYTSDQVFQLGAALYLDSWQLAAAMAEFLQLDLLETFAAHRIQPDVLPAAFCRRNLVLPVCDDTGAAGIVLANPFQLEVTDILKRRFKAHRLLLAPPELIEDVLDPDFRQSERYQEWSRLQHLRLGRPAGPPATSWGEKTRLQAAPEQPRPGSEPAAHAVSPAPAGELEPLSAMNSDLDAQQMEQRLFRAYRAYRDQKQGQAPLGATDLTVAERDPEVAPIIHLVNSLIEKAHHLGASDIHIEPWKDEVLIRYRIDGQLRIMHRLQPQAIIKPLITRIKIMSQLDISERRLPQDGNIPFAIFSPGHDISLRVSIVPLHHGEKAVLRLLDSNRGLLPLDQAGFSPAALTAYRRLIQSPYGMILHVGPTGSGKTTTLYAALNAINRPNRNLSTLEDPIEYVLPGINQLQVRHEIGLDFARTLRAYLRQDPDVLLVGEIRDEETAHVAVEAAMTGHLLFSTLHTNDAAATIIRLLEMGIKPYMISSSLLAICAQRLLRRLCLHCRQPYAASSEQIRDLGLQAEQVQLYHAVGCEHCQDGYQGRIGIYELLVLDDGLRQVINQPAITSERIKAAAVEKTGMRTLFQEGLTQVLAGLTSLEELTLNILPDRSLEASA